MNIDYKVIGKRIQAERKGAGITQESLAEKLDVSIGYVSQVERGITKISLDLLAAIADILNCDIALLVTGTSLNDGQYLASETAKNFKLLNNSERRLVDGFINLLLENRK